MNIIAVDPSLRSTGVFFVKDGEVDAYVIRMKSPKNEVLAFLLRHFLLKANEFDLLIIEDYAFSAKGEQASIQGEVGGIIRACFQAKQKKIIEVPISSWHSYTKIKVKKGGGRNWEGDYCNEVASKFKVRLQTADEADAFLLFATVRAAVRGKFLTPGAAKIRIACEEMGITSTDFRTSGGQG